MTTLLPFSFKFVTTLLDKQNSGVCENKPCKPRVLTAIRPVWCGRTVALTRGVCLAPVEREEAWVCGSSPAAGPGSHPSDVGPGGEGVQLEHGLAPAVEGHRDAEDANDVHDYSCLCLWEGN